MNFRVTMRVFVLLALFAGIGRAAATATPNQDAYLVYEGTASLSAIAGGSSTIKPIAVPFSVYLVVDLANPTNFALLTYNSNSGYHIYTRILSDDGTSMTAYRDGVLDTTADPAQNFFTNITTIPQTSGYGVLRFSNTTQVDSLTINNVANDYKNSTQVMATGALSGLGQATPLVLVPARPKAKVSGVYTLNAVPSAITNYIGTPGNATILGYAPKLTGSLFDYDYDPTLITSPDPELPTIAFTSLTGTVTLTLNVPLTTIANVGGSFKVIGKNSPIPMNAISGRLTTSSSPTVYEDFLYETAQSLGLSAGYVPSP